MFVLDCGFLCTGLILNIIPSALLLECMNALQWDFARKWKKMHMLSLSYTKYVIDRYMLNKSINVVENIGQNIHLFKFLKIMTLEHG